MQILSIVALEALFWGLTALDILLTAGRLYMHWAKLKKTRFDDLFNVSAVVFLIAFMVTWQRYVPLELPAQLYEAGKTDVPPSGDYDPLDSMKNDFANIVVFWCCIYSVKASFLALYWQIFEVSRRFRVAWAALTAYVVLSFFVTTLSVFWHCGSPATLMNIPSCKRWKPRAVTIMYIGAVLHIVGDLLLMALPIVMIRNLQMRTREKIGLGVIFALVLINVAFAVLRVVFTTQSVFRKDSDMNTLWTSLDPIVAVLVCTLPCYRNLILASRTASVTRTTSSFSSSQFGSMFKKSSSSRSKKGTLSNMEMDDISTKNLTVDSATHV